MNPANQARDGSVLKKSKRVALLITVPVVLAACDNRPPSPSAPGVPGASPSPTPYVTHWWQPGTWFHGGGGYYHSWGGGWGGSSSSSSSSSRGGFGSHGGGGFGGGE